MGACVCVGGGGGVYQGRIQDLGNGGGGWCGRGDLAAGARLYIYPVLAVKGGGRTLLVK